MDIRWYQPQDEPYLMELERLCPRGEPRPFVHFRRRFVDRASLYDQSYTFVAEKDGLPVGVTTVVLKDTVIGGDSVRLAYSFDTRVHPHHRRQGIANAMQEEKLHFLRANGVHGIYAFVISTNYPSLNMLEKVGFHRARLILYMTFPPYPMIYFPEEMPASMQDASHYEDVLDAHQHKDLFINDVAYHVANYRFEHICIRCGSRHFASLSLFDQSMVYQQVSADEPWPTEQEVSRRGRNIRIFDEVGITRPEQLRAVFDYIRDGAVSSNVNKLTWIIDRMTPLPTFVFEEATDQKDYWMMMQSLVPDWEPQWDGKPVYIDARDL